MNWTINRLSLSFKVYGWGYNGGGQIGTGNSSNQLSPVKVTALTGTVIKKIVCGHSHTLAISDEGILYSWGSNSFGQLGIGSKNNTSSPTRVHLNDMYGTFDEINSYHFCKYYILSFNATSFLISCRIIDIAAIHYNHISAALSKNFKVYMWGQCKGMNL